MPARFTWVLLTWLCGCSTTAKISLVNGGQVEAKILGGDQDELFVETAVGTEVPIARAEISSIDHPGNMAAIFGGLLSAYGAWAIVEGGSTCGQREVAPEAYCAGVFLPGAVGASVLIWGVATWLGSTHAATASSTPRDSNTVPDPPPASAFDFSLK